MQQTRLTVLVATTVLCLLASACSNPGVAVPSPPPSNITIYASVGDQALDAVANARVEIVGGPADGQFAITDARGNCALTATVGGTTVVFRVSAAGYTGTTLTLSVPRQDFRWGFEVRY